ncbi:LysR family transcriptional regulator [Cupriavidus numazuensis]|uniref:Hca operon transcriptional activator HcaR n=1 Tax=Cupriavidus numazuensis TaxID=221992 RepID=A0ABN7Q9F9_9BURK|nr:LysR family transcriptional regulator [Cupriavidus numazuensis]CAG2159946.1 Hca operon transcriptional activator HcaR [Cupriavidus numazuensis]
MRTIEMRHLRYFIAVAESQSIIAASRALNIVQPALSRQIRDLENQVGTPLFVRHTRGVELTPAGASFLLDARQILRDAADACERASQIGQGLSGTLKIGVLPNYLFLPETLAILGHFRDHQADVMLSVEPMLSLQQAESIRNGELDGGIMAWRPKEDATLRGVRLLRDGFVLALPSASAQAASLPERLADVASETFIWFSRDRSAPQHDALIAACARAGFVPNIAQIGTDIPTILGLVAAGMGCAFVPASVRPVCPPTVHLVALKDLNVQLDVEFVCSADTCPPTVERFLASVRSVVRSAGRHRA